MKLSQHIPVIGLSLSLAVGSASATPPGALAADAARRNTLDRIEKCFRENPGLEERVKSARVLTSKEQSRYNYLQQLIDTENGKPNNQRRNWLIQSSLDQQSDILFHTQGFNPNTFTSGGNSIDPSDAFQRMEVRLREESKSCK